LLALISDTDLFDPRTIVAKDIELPELGVLNLVWGYIISLPRKSVYENLFEARSPKCGEDMKI
jgi:hypothetical protein